MLGLICGGKAPQPPKGGVVYYMDFVAPPLGGWGALGGFLFTWINHTPHKQYTA